ncbi:MarR family winged helix-turn-helix transcriptional regulator [Brucella gallinifaecis]|uniref:MarR family winged helix-turn-helix transcriptional regulator n=1 Tax=Brucella gallinifaecis TaxID=215590 RepID=UPI00235FF2F0|nr:MarR family transcriptional regulator [Brucella gallinifaecis]
MEIMEQKHDALLGELERRHSPFANALKTCFEVLSLAAAIDRDCANRLAPHKLSEGKFILLFLLENSPDGLSPHELSERAGVTRATITGLLDGLERDGFLMRHADTQDRRKLTVRLTPDGAHLAQQLFDQHTAWIAGLMSDLSTGEQQLLSTLLRRIWSRTDAGQSFKITETLRDMT